VGSPRLCAIVYILVSKDSVHNADIIDSVGVVVQDTKGESEVSIVSMMYCIVQSQAPNIVEILTRATDHEQRHMAMTGIVKRNRYES